ncbi:MAG: hypothetical protein ACOZAQ_01250 [Pseudomonadota bacterium]
MKKCRRCASAVLAVALGMQARATGAEMKSEEEKVAADLANPLAPVTTMTGQFRAEFGSGPDDDVNFQLRLQPSFFKPFSDRSAFLLRTIVPVQFKNWPTDGTGLGDITLVPYYVPDIMKETFLGYGATIGIPCATEDALGSGKWTAGPAMIMARTGNPITYGGLIQHIWSYAGDNESDDVSVTTLQPFFTYLLGGGWAASLNVEASYNWNADADKWTIPLAASMSKVVNIGGKYLNIGVAVVTYADKPDYAPDWELRANVTYVFR